MGGCVADPKYLKGLCFIVLVAVIWAAASILAQDIFEDIKAPLFLTYVGACLYTIHLPVWWASKLLGLISTSADPGSLSTRARSSDKDQTNTTNDQRTPALSHFGTGKIAMRIAPVWFLANFSYNWGLALTSVTSSTVIAASSSLFTFLFSIVLLSESFTMPKFYGVLLCIAGTILVGLADKVSPLA